MAFDKKQKDFGVVKIQGDKVQIYSSSASYTTIAVGKPVLNAVWAGDFLNITCSDGKVRRYSSTASYTTI